MGEARAQRTGVEYQFGVIVPTVLGAGLLFSAVVYLRDLAHRWRGRHPLHRRALIEGHSTALLATNGPRPAARDRTGLRSRAFYAVAAAGLIALAIYLAIGSFGNFRGWTAWARDISWIWCVFLLAASLAAWAAVSSLAMAVSWNHRPPGWARSFVIATPLARVPVDLAAAGGPRPSATTPRLRDETVRWLHRTAEIWGAAAIVLVGLVTALDRAPRAPEGDILGVDVTEPLIIAALLLAVAGLAIGRRFTALSAVLLATVAAFLGLISSVAYRPPVAVTVTALFAVPAVLQWYAWQHRRSVRAVIVLATATAALLIGVALAAGAVYDHYWGPAHPESTVAAPPPSPVEWIWAGGTATDSTRVNAKIRGSGDAIVRMAVSEHADLRDARWSEPTEPDDRRIVRFDVTALQPDVEYHYALTIDGVVDTVRQGRVRTLPSGPSSFRIAAGACARTGSNGAVFDLIREREPLLFLGLGDVHYANIDRNSPAAFRRALDEVLTAPAQAALYRSTSTTYVWDDHDYGGNDADATSPSRPAAQLVYREYVPSATLPAGDDGGIYQAFTVGRLRFVVTDTRSYRSPASTPEDRRTLLGQDQLKWFEAELQRAADAGLGVVWLTPTPWVGPASPSSDTWAGFDVERRRIADVIANSGLSDRLVMLAGDAHMVAIDDGSNTDYSSARAGGFPLLHAAALDRPGGVKGGPYSEGAFPGAGQFGELDVDDSGGSTVGVTLRGLRYTGETIIERSYTLTLPDPETL